LASELTKRKETLQADIIELSKIKDSIDSKEKRRYKALVNKIHKLEQELSTAEKRFSNIIEVQREQLRELNADKELKSNTFSDPTDKDVLLEKATKLIDNIEENRLRNTDIQIIEKDEVYDKYVFKERLGEGTEIIHQHFVVSHNSPTIYPNLVRDGKGELYREN